jgi:hypothetical protein
MQQNHPAQRIEFAQTAHVETVAAAVAKVEQDAADAEPEIKPAIYGWVRDHEHRSEEYRRAFKDLLTEEGFISSQATGHAQK